MQLDYLLLSQNLSELPPAYKEQDIPMAAGSIMVKSMSLLTWNS